MLKCYPTCSSKNTCRAFVSPFVARSKCEPLFGSTRPRISTLSHLDCHTQMTADDVCLSVRLSVGWLVGLTVGLCLCVCLLVYLSVEEVAHSGQSFSGTIASSQSTRIKLYLTVGHLGARRQVGNKIDRKQD